MQPADAGQSLRSSRRRVQKHSAVVLNADRLKKFSSTNLEETAVLDDSFIIQHEQNQSFATIATVTTVESHSNLLINFRVKVDEKEAVKVIERWWQYMLSKRLWRYTQRGKWKISAADRVFSIILGYRVRRLLSLNDCQKLTMSEMDVRKVISELLFPYARSTVLAGEKQNSPLDEETISRKSVVLVAGWLLNLQELAKSHSLLSGPDQQLIKSLIKQLLLERSKVYKYIFDKVCYWSFPKPGYWHLRYQIPSSNRASLVIKKSTRSTPTRPIPAAILLNADNANTLNGSPIRSDRRPIHIEETPPHVKQALQNNEAEQRSQRNKLLPFKFLPQHNNHGTPNHDSVLSVSNFGANRSLFHVDEESNSLQESTEGDTEELIILKRPSTAPNNGATMTTVQSKKPLARPSTTATGRSTVGIAPSSSSSSSAANNAAAAVRKRTHDGGHIQLEVISGEKIMPAKKTGNKDGSIIPDRKPSIKVTFYMPTSAAIANQSIVASSTTNVASGAGLSSMKKIYQISRDFDKITLNPAWNSNFTITLPFSKIVLKQFAEKIITSATLDHHTHKLTITDQEYDALVKALLHSWLSGVIEIEVYDNERFNEDIFLGKVTLLITSFMPLIRKFDQLEMKGRFQLEKNKPNNRVSGSILLHAFLHVPEKAHLEEQILQLYGYNIPPNLGSFTINNTTTAPKVVPSQYPVSYQVSSNPQPSLSAVPHSYSNDVLQDSMQSMNRMSKSLSRRISSVQQLGHGTTVAAAGAAAYPSNHQSNMHQSPEESKYPQPRPASRGTPIDFNTMQQQQTTPPSDHSGSAPTSRPMHTPEYELHDTAEDELEHSDILNQGVFISNFMKTIQQQCTPDRDRKVRPSNTTGVDSEGRDKRQMFARHSPSVPDDFPDPQLEESENIRLPILQQQIMNGSSIPHAMNMPSRSPEDMHTSSNSKVSLSTQQQLQQQQQQQHAQRSLDKIRNNNVSVSSIVNKETALESSKTRRNFLSDMIKQLDDLSIMQQNAGEVVDHISKKLEAKKAAVLESKEKPSSLFKVKSPEHRISNTITTPPSSVASVEKVVQPLPLVLPATPAEKSEQCYPKGFNRHRHAYQHHRVPQPPPSAHPTASTPDHHLEVEAIEDIPITPEHSGIHEPADIHHNHHDHDDHEDDIDDESIIQQSLDTTARKLEDLDYPQFQEDSENEEMISAHHRSTKSNKSNKSSGPKVVYVQLNLIAEDDEPNPDDDEDDDMEEEEEEDHQENEYSVGDEEEEKEDDDYIEDDHIEDDSDDHRHPLDHPEEVYEPVEDEDYDDTTPTVLNPRHVYHDHHSQPPSHGYVSMDFLPPLSEGEEKIPSMNDHRHKQKQKHVQSTHSSQSSSQGNYTKKIQYHTIVDSDDEEGHSARNTNTNMNMNTNSNTKTNAKTNAKFFSPVKKEGERAGAGVAGGSSSGSGSRRSRSSFHRLKQLESSDDEDDSDSTTSSLEHIISTKNQHIRDRDHDRTVIAMANHEPIRVHSPANQYMYHQDRASPNQELRQQMTKAKSPIISPGRRRILDNHSGSVSPGAHNRSKMMNKPSSNAEQVHKVVKRVLELDHMEL